MEKFKKIFSGLTIAYGQYQKGDRGSNGKLKGTEIELIFQPRKHGKSKLDVAIVWDFLVSLVHTFFQRVIPRKAISFAFVGAIGVVVQFCVVYS